MLNIRKSSPGCFRPRSFYNKTLGEHITCSCGHCEACLLDKANSRTSFLNYLEEICPCCFFVTLTYDDEHLPIAQFINYNSDLSGDLPFLPGVFNLVTGTYPVKEVYRFSYYERKMLNKSSAKDIVFGSEPLGYVDLKNLSSIDYTLLENGYTSKTGKHFGKFQWPYARKQDGQNFFKRLRKYLNIFTDANLYYYFVAEYGPQTLRPHFHCILFFDQVLPHSKILECVRNCWKSGFVDVQSVQSSAASYVSSYLSNFARLPQFLNIKKTRPFFLQSHFSSFAKSKTFFDVWKKIIDSYVDRRIVSTSDGDIFCTYPSSVKGRLFPKCSDFVHKDFTSLCNMYKLYNSGNIKVEVNEIDNYGLPYCSGRTVVPVTYLSKLCSTPVDNLESHKMIKVVDSHYYADYLWFKRVRSLSLEFDVHPAVIIRRIVDWYYDNELLRLAFQYDVLSNNETVEDVLCGLLSYNDIFYLFSYVKHISDLPDYYKRLFKLQNLLPILFDEYGKCKIDSNNLGSLRNFDSYVVGVKSKVFSRVKTKGLNDLYNPL